MGQNKGYLVYDFKEHIGELDNHLFLLRKFLSVSLLLNRVPVITGFHSAPHANLGLPRKVVWFQNYVDLSKTQIFKLKPDKTVEQTVSFLQWVSEQDFDLQSFPEEQVGNVYLDEYAHDRAIQVLLENESYTVLCIKFRYQKSLEVLTAANFLGDAKQFSYFTLLQPSRAVEQLTDIVLNRLGTNRNDIIRLKKESMKQPRVARKFMPRVVKLTDRFYACLHVSEKHYNATQANYYFASLRKQIQKAISATNLSSGAKLYIMSDIHDPKYFDFLKSDYQVYRYYDFPELQELVTGRAGSVDNYMLYSVEKNIMSYALIQIVPPESNLLVLRLDASYHVPFFIKVWHVLRYRIPVMLKKIKHYLNTG